MGTYFVAPSTVTEQEFTVALSVDAAYGASYELRITNDGVQIPLMAAPRITVGAAPAPLASPGQKQGEEVPNDTQVMSARTYALIGAVGDSARRRPSTPLLYGPCHAAGRHGPGLRRRPRPARPRSTTPDRRRRVGSAASATRPTQRSRRHWSRSRPETDQCYTCHAGGVGGADVQAQYALGQPENDPATRSYWSHDTTVPGDHVLDSDNEFEGKLSRHSQCSDCHDPHGATTTKSVMTPAGWTAPGGFAKVAGIAVTNGAAGTAPTYTWLDGMVQPVTAEYQLLPQVPLGLHDAA